MCRWELIRPGYIRACIWTISLEMPRWIADGELQRAILWLDNIKRDLKVVERMDFLERAELPSD